MPFTAIFAFLTRKSSWVTILVVLGVLVCGFAITNYVITKSRNLVLTSQLKAEQAVVAQYRANAEANAKAIATRNTLITALATTEVSKRAETIKALKANPAWSEQPIPADVLNSLR